MVGGTNLSLHMPASHFTAKTAGCEVEISSGSPPLCHIGGGFRFQGVAREPQENPHQETLPLACLHWVLRRVGHKDPRLKSCTRRRENPMVSCQREPQDSWVTW